MSRARASARCFLLMAGLGVVSSVAFAAGTDFGHMAGKVVRPDGRGVPAVTVSIQSLDKTEITEHDGSFGFRRVPVGTVTVIASLGKHVADKSDVRVSAGETVHVLIEVDWPEIPMETVTVRSVSRRRERLVSSPAAVTIVTRDLIVEDASAGNIPRVLEFTPGVEVARGSLNWFVINARGFTTAMNNRLMALIDGRDLSLVFLRAADWGSSPFPCDDFGSVEFVRGPSSALYGADAFNGVVSVTTATPQDSLGGTARVTLGERNTTKLDVRHAMALGGGWHLKLAGTYTRDDPNSRSRTSSVEYTRPCSFYGDRDCLPLEATPVVERDLEQKGGVIRVDKDFGRRGLLTLEAGRSRYSDTEAVLVASTRFQVYESERPFFRVNYSAPHWNLLAYQDSRDVESMTLNTGELSYVDERRRHLELQGHTRFGGEKGLVVGGASYRHERVDTANPQGVQTMLLRPRSQDFLSVYGQLEWSFNDTLRSVLAVRWDDSSFQDGRVSPRASFVYSVTPDQTLRFNYSYAFKLPNYTDYFMWIDVAPPVDLAPFESFCAPYGVSCGFDAPVPVLATGNESLDVEKIRSFEIGYRAIVGRNVYLTADLYTSRIDDFITDLLPLNNARLGRINPNLPPYSPPAALPAEAAAALLGTLEASLPPEFYAVMSNDPSGGPFFVPFSVTNYGRVDTRGAELGLLIRPRRHWMLDVGYTWFDFDVKNELPDDPLLPNTATHKYSDGVSYRSPRCGATLKYRHVQGFDWRTGVFWGYVPAHDVVNLTASARLNDAWEVGVDVDNLFNEVHFEQFGGDLLQRRALVYTKLGW
ncbi:MAG: TonB-dependent receptor [Acidobacteriota bacterium]|nr:MAG: TonB-dependent receptor [Acidobacteriota bacterium]